MLYMIEAIRRIMPDIVLSFTFPAETQHDEIARPFRDVAKYINLNWLLLENADCNNYHYQFRYAHPDLDYINVYRGRAGDVAALSALGVPREKV